VLVTRLARHARRWAPEVASLFGDQGSLADGLRAAGVPVHALHKRLGPDPRVPLRLRALLRERAPDVVHTHGYPLGYLQLTPGRWPTVHTLHTLADREVGWTGLLHRWAWRRGALPVGVSAEVAASATARYGVPVRAVLNGVNLDARPSRARDVVRESLDTAADAFVVLIVARLDPVKDHGTLVRAFEAAAGPSWALWIAGDGPERNAIAATVGASPARDRIRLLGARDDVPDLLGAADVVTLCSRFEGIPLALQEAMAAGRAVVATDVGGLPDLVAHGRTGLLVPAGDAAALGAALGELHRDPLRRAVLGRAARVEAEARMGIGATVEAYERLYDGLLR
jgi:glycosyltransferase involved in cell wall biosynthesis